MKTYLDLLSNVMTSGEKRSDRTGTGTISIFGAHFRHDLSQGFPLLTTKKMFFKGIIYELIWFISGSQNISWLKNNDVHIWDDWADYHGHVGPVYGKQWREWETASIARKYAYVDQLAQVIESIKVNPYSRRHIVSAWNVADLPRMVLPPCHVMYQFYVHTDGRLDCQMYQRSADIFLGAPFNIASYAALTMMVSQLTGLTPGDLVINFGDLHIYNNHIDQVKEQLSRETYALPTLSINPDVQDIDAFKYEDFYLENYHPHPAIVAPISI